MPEAVASPFDFDTEASAEFDTPIEHEAKPQEGAAKPAVAATPAPIASGKEAAPVQKHSKLSVQFAKDLDFTDEEIAELSPEALDAAVRLEHRRMLKTSKEFRRNEATNAAPGPQTPAKPAPAAEVENPAEPDEYEGFEEFRDVLVPQVVKAIRKSRDADKQEIKTLRAEVDEFKGEKRQAAIAKFFDAVDKEFDAMPAAVKAVIGSGGRAEVKPVHRAVRKAILEAAEADTEGSWQDKLKRAARSIVGEEAFAEREVEEEPEPAPKPAQAKTPDGRFASKPQEEREAAWKGAGAAKPTQRDSPLPKGDERAMKVVAKFLPALDLDTNIDDFPA